MTPVLERLHGKKLLLAASTGGHLSQLHRLAERIEPSEDSLWVTFDKPQSRSLLQDERHRFIPYISPRDWAGVARGMRTFDRILRSESFDAVVSTGAAIALSSHLTSRRRRVPTIYIESVSRFDGPSVTGRILQRVPGIERFAQHDGYSPDRWSHEFSVLDTYHRDESWVGPDMPASIFVTLGTISPYRFDRLVEKLLSVAPKGTEFVWQLGVTDRTDLPGEVHTEMSAEAFSRAAREADLVVTHAGVGTVMGLLDMRRPSLVVPRRRSRNEHVDDHQLQITREVQRRGLAASSEVDDIDLDTLRQAAGIRVQ